MHHTRTRTHATATRRGRSLCVDDGVRAGRPRDIVMSEFSWSTSCEGSPSLLEHSAKSQRDGGQGLPPQARPLGRSNSQTLHQSIRSFMCGCWFRSNDRSSLTATRTGTHNGYDKPECKGDESKSPVSMGTCQTLPGSSPSVRQRWLRRVCFEPLPQSCLYTFMIVRRLCCQQKSKSGIVAGDKASSMHVEPYTLRALYNVPCTASLFCTHDCIRLVEPSVFASSHDLVDL